LNNIEDFGQAMTTTRLEFVEGNSSKFWQLVLSGSSTTVSYGKIGTNGQSQEKDHGSAAAAAKFAAKMIAEKEKKGYKRSSDDDADGDADDGGDDDDEPAKHAKKKPRTSDDGAISEQRLAQLRKQLEVLEAELEEEDPDETWQEKTVDPLVLAVATVRDGDVGCLCPVTQLSATKQREFPWTWKPTLGEFIETTWASLPDSAPLIAQLKRDVREIVAVQTEDNEWKLVYAMRAGSKKLDGTDLQRYEDYRTNLSFAIGSAPASAKTIAEAARRLKKTHDWEIDAQLLAMWGIHSQVEACNSANGEWYIGPGENITVPPQEFRLQKDIYGDGDYDFDPKEFAELICDTGGVACAMFRINKKTNEQAVVSWDHETPGSDAEGLESNAGRTIVDFLRMTVFSGDGDGEKDE
jgi:predicted DNA-binding WGR domain protein